MDWNNNRDLMSTTSDNHPVAGLGCDDFPAGIDHDRLSATLRAKIARMMVHTRGSFRE